MKIKQWTRKNLTEAQRKWLEDTEELANQLVTGKFKSDYPHEFKPGDTPLFEPVKGGEKHGWDITEYELPDPPEE